MAKILIASDASYVLDDVRSVLASGDEAILVGEGRMVAPVAKETRPDLAILDMQIGSMGAIAACLDLRLEESGGRMDHVPVLILLDRRADVFLVRRADAEGWLVKPIDPIRMRRAITAVRTGGTYEDDAFRPSPVLVGEDPA
jgi:DNA-binding NarL/FixJ family response regulator